MTYPLINIVTITVCAIVAGADDFVSIAARGRQKRTWLEQFLDLSNGIPSHDRFNAVLPALVPAELVRCLLSWITALHDDPSLYARRSVANHLGDLSKDHPQLVLALCERWQRGAAPERKWLLRHALR